MPLSSSSKGPSQLWGKKKGQGHDMSAEPSPRRPQPIVPESLRRKASLGGQAGLDLDWRLTEPSSVGGGGLAKFDQLLDGVSKRKTEITQNLASLRLAAESTDSQSVCSISASEWDGGKAIQNVGFGRLDFSGGHREQLLRKSDDVAGATSDKGEKKDKQKNDDTNAAERSGEDLAESDLRAHPLVSKKEWKTPSHVNLSDADSICSTERRMIYSNRLRRRMASKKFKESEGRHRKGVSTAVQTDEINSTQANLADGLQEALQIFRSILDFGKDLEALVSDSETHSHGTHAEPRHNDSEQSPVHESNESAANCAINCPEVLRLPQWDPFDRGRKGKGNTASHAAACQDTRADDNRPFKRPDAVTFDGNEHIDERLTVTAAARDLVMKEFPDIFSELLPRKFKL